MQLKVLHIIPSLNKGGAERMVATICAELHIRKNVEVTIAIFNNSNTYSTLIPHDIVTHVPASYVPSITGKAIDNTQQLSEYIHKLQPHVIHTHLWEAEVVAHQVSYEKAKWVTHFHDNMSQLSKWKMSFSKITLTNYFERLFMLKKYESRRKEFICISEENKRYVISVLPKLKRNIHLLHNAINLTLFSNTDVPQINETCKLITIGGLNKNKNQIFLLSVVENLIAKGLSVSLDILGDGPLRNEIELQIRERNLSHIVFCRGNIDAPEEYLKKSNIYVHSALSEGFGLTMVEAMATGLPVVAIDAKGNRDIIENGKNGFLIQEQNAEDFANRIAGFVNDSKLYTECSVNAKDSVKRFSIENYIDNLLEIYTS